MARILWAAAMVSIAAVALHVPVAHPVVPRAGMPRVPQAFEASPHAGVFTASAGGYRIDLTPGGAEFHPHGSRPFRMSWPRPVEAQPEGLLPGVANYFIGNNPAGWRKDVKRYARIRYREIEPGVDLVFYGSGNDIEYDLVVAPGADLSRVALNFEDSGEVAVSAGKLSVRAGAGELRQLPPRAWQGARSVAARFRRLGARRVGFAVDGYEPSLPLVVDPVMVFSTYLGSSSTGGLIPT